MSEARPIRDAVETVIFGTETRGGNLFDVALLITILASVAVVMLDSMDVYHAVYGDLFRTLEIGFTSGLHRGIPGPTLVLRNPWPMPSAFGALSIF